MGGVATLDTLADYADGDGNTISTGVRLEQHVAITFKGRDNRLVVAPGSRLRRLTVTFHGHGGEVRIGANPTVGTPQLNLRVGHRGRIILGDDLSTTTTMFVSAVEGASVTFGRDVMVATHVHVRTDDSHAIYDVSTRRRVNPAADVTVGDHVWLGYEATVLRGSDIGPGSVVGTRSIVSGVIDNNCVAVGSPARVVRRDIAWERPYLWLSEGPDDWPAFDGEPPPHWRPTDSSPGDDCR